MPKPFVITSKGGVGLVIFTVLQILLPTIGIEVEEGSIMAFVNALGTVVGFILMAYGQWDREDLKFGIIRKQKK